MKSFFKSSRKNRLLAYQTVNYKELARVKWNTPVYPYNL